MTNIMCERPWVFYGLVLLIPVICFILFRYTAFIRTVGSGSSVVLRKIRRAVISRLVWWSAAWCMVIVAVSGLSWGMEPVAVPRTGSAVSFVFDISWSMTAEDAASGGTVPVTRLEAAAAYADELLNLIPGTDVSVVLAKGDGIIAVPLTSDVNAVRALLPALSPQLMTAEGSSIGSGILAAAGSFPVLSVASRTIVVFTDGEETDGLLETAVADTVKSGIQLVFLGFGSETETEILSGDGVTPVQTAFRASVLEQIISVVESYTSLYTIQQSAPELYCIPARQPGSAYQIRNTIVQTKGNADGTTGTVYELHPVRRWPVFVLLALLFLIAGFVSSEFNPLRFRKVASTGLMILLCCSSVLMQGCSGDWEGTVSVLSGTFNWHRGNYRESAADFLRTVEYAEQQQNPQLKQYGIYGLAATYLMQGETAAADSRLQEISPDAPDEIRFAASYNAGIIAYRNGLYQEAAGYFRQALEIDNLNIDAKLNFELSRQQQTVQSSGGIQEMIPVSENNNEIGPEQMLFSLVREQEENRWKNKQSFDVSKSGADY